MTKVRASSDLLRELDDYERRLAALERRAAGGSVVTEIFNTDICHIDSPISAGWRIKEGTRLFATSDGGFVRWAGQIEWYGGLIPNVNLTENIANLMGPEMFTQYPSTWLSGRGIPAEVSGIEFAAFMLDSHEADGSNPHVLQVYVSSGRYLFNANGGIYNSPEENSIGIFTGTHSGMPEGYVIDLGGLGYWHTHPEGAEQ